MKKLLKSCLLSSVLLVCAPSINAQVNMLLDGSFEDTTSNWQDFAGTFCLQQWWDLDSSGQRCRYEVMSYLRLKDANLKLPKNGHVTQDAFHGNNIIWLSSWCPACGLGPFGRSIVRAKLRQHLIPGAQYCLEVHAIAFDLSGSHYTNGLGVYLDNGGLDTMATKHNDFTGTYDFVNPQFQAPTVITDTIAWTTFKHTFTATGTETYFTIGNFQSDSATLKVPFMQGTCPACNDYGIDAFSLIPVDLANWLHDTFTTLGDSVWVGLDKFDYFKGQWYNTADQKITTAAGFWFTPTSTAPTSFIHEVEVCGVLKKDTCVVYVYPTGITDIQSANKDIKVWPNPSSGVFTVDINTKLIGTPLQILDAAGKVVYTNIAAIKMNIDLSALPDGVYTIKIGAAVSKVVLASSE
jgi:hypothetical protein